MFALVVITALSVVITIFFYSSGKQSLPSYLYFAFNFGMFANVFFPHLAATIVLKRYCPGLLTGILFLVPTTAYLLMYGYDNRYFVFPMFWFVALPFAALVVGIIPVLFMIGRLCERVLKSSNSVQGH